MNPNKLFITSDLYDNSVFYIRTASAKFARLKKTDGVWKIWIYPYGIPYERKTLASALNLIERSFRRWVCGTQ